MKAEQQRAAVKTLMQIPGINRAVADGLVVLNITEKSHLKGLSAEQLYRRLIRETGVQYPESLIQALQLAITFAANQAN
jgi:hypothetical protein